MKNHLFVRPFRNAEKEEEAQVQTEPLNDGNDNKVTNQPTAWRCNHGFNNNCDFREWNVLEV